MRIIEQQHVNDSKSSGRHEKGQAAVEFALTAVFLVLLIVAFLEMVMMLYTYNVLADSAKGACVTQLCMGPATQVPVALPLPQPLLHPVLRRT